MNKQDFLRLFAIGFLSGVGLLGLLFLAAIGMFF